MSSPSFERIDYQLRYNKHIERRLVFDLLGRARHSVDLSSHGYLGFGSMWFTDFRLAHRVLELDEMLSMEREEHAERARFNQPYCSITVQGGDSATTIAKFDSDYWSKPHVAWLDYDGQLSQDVVKDLYVFLDNCAPASVLIITINGIWRRYRATIAADQPRRRSETAVGQVEAMLGAEVVHPRFEPGPENAVGTSPDIQAGRFPEFLAEAVLAAMSHRIAVSGRKSGTESIRFVPLFNFCHKDMAEMVTVGGAIATASREELWAAAREGVPLNDEGTLPLHQRLDLVPLTLKEKLALDACLPQAEANFFATARAAGLRLDERELAKYWRYFRQFPVFFETPL